MAKRKNKETCILDGCELKPYSRGLCQQHYRNATGIIGSERSREEKLIAVGMILPAKRPGRPRMKTKP